MRSRYCAYALGRVDYVMATTHPDNPQRDPDPVAWRASVSLFAERTRFEGLRVLETPDPAGDVGFVTFSATLSQLGQDASFAERSRFERVDGRWLYHSGERLEL